MSAIAVPDSELLLVYVLTALAVAISRRLGAVSHLDALATLDVIINATAADPYQRPHQLFLTGDQIYADDVADALLHALTDAGNALLGWEEILPGVDKKPQKLEPGDRRGDGSIPHLKCGYLRSSNY